MTPDYHDETTGKPYDARLVKRLLVFIRPYRRTVAAAVAILILVAGFELAFPFLMRSAIDDYIVATTRILLADDSSAPVEGAVSAVTRGGPGSEAAALVAGFVSEHRDDLLPVDDFGSRWEGTRPAKAYLVTTKDLSGYDPREVARASELGIILEDSYYSAARERTERAGLAPDEFVVAGDRIALPGDVLAALSPEQIRILREDDFRGVGRITLIILVILAVSFGFTLLEINMMELTSQRVMYDIRMKVLKHMMKLSLSFFDKNPVGRLVTRATNDVQVLHEMFTSIVTTLLRDLFVLVGVVIVLLRLNWRLALVSLTVLPFMAWATAAFSVRIRDAFREVRVKVAKINAMLQESIGGMRVTQIFAHEEESLRRFSGINHENFLAAMKQIRAFAMFMPLMDLAGSTAIGLVIWYGGGSVIRNTLSLGTVVAFLAYVQMFFRPLRNLAQQYGTMQQAMASSERIFMLLDNDQVILDPEKPVRPDTIEGRICFENVSFSYVEGEQVLRDVSFTVEPGETVAIVGATGAGKTSIISLIERFYDVEEGRISLDGIDLRRMDRSFVRSHIGLVMQDVFLFAGDIGGNIRLGNQAIDDDRLREMAQYVNADAFIERLPGGYDEEVHERGVTLSTGQRQLLAFARALAFDPTILILDEATSNIDTETEHLIQEALVRLMEGRTSIVIAHRLSTIQHADKILVMHHGKIREVGTHHDLLSRRGYYYRLYQLQYAQ
jgi:ABC-type multidrug transport system fused ATPase/permease subunit